MPFKLNQDRRHHIPRQQRKVTNCTGRGAGRGSACPFDLQSLLPNGHAVIGYGFFTAGDTPHMAIARLVAQWPGLRFSLVPRPAD
jgi:hypothetical protein